MAKNIPDAEETTTPIVIVVEEAEESVTNVRKKPKKKKNKKQDKKGKDKIVQREVVPEHSEKESINEVKIAKEKDVFSGSREKVERCKRTS